VKKKYDDLYYKENFFHFTVVSTTDFKHLLTSSIDFNQNKILFHVL